jgi:menaquinone-9 beta-reductase
MRLFRVAERLEASMSMNVAAALDADVIVAGAGPGGSAAAAVLARSGARVIAVDRQRFPRDKVCGDFVGPLGLVELAGLGVTNKAGYLGTYAIHQAMVVINGEPALCEGIPQTAGLPGYGRVIPRMVLDQWLFECAQQSGAVMLQDRRVTDFDVGRDCVEVEITESGGTTRRLRAALLIGADGATSVVARRLHAHSASLGNPILAVRGYFDGVRATPHQAELYFNSESFPGYFWFFPAGDSIANVGVGMAGETLPGSRMHLREMLLDLAQSDPLLRTRLQGARLRGTIAGWPLSTYSPNRSVIADRVLLVGDAAGLINPLNGEGIQFALQSGRWAAETALACLWQRSFGKEALAAYQRKVEDELRYDMAISAMIVQMIRNRDLNPFWLWALRVITARAKRDPVYGRLAAGMVAGVVPTHTALGTRMLGGTLEQALVSLARDGASAIRNPGSLVDPALTLGEMGLHFLSNLMKNPRDVLGWTRGLLAQSIELGAQTATHTARDAVEASRSLLGKKLDKQLKGLAQSCTG